MYINIPKVALCLSLLIPTMHLTEAMQVPAAEDPQEGSLLCQLPQNVLHLIAEKLYQDELSDKSVTNPSGWKIINILGLTCKMLDRRMTALGKPIKLRFPEVEKVDTAYFVLCIHALKRFASRDGYNPIFVNLKDIFQKDDMSKLLQFIDCCAEQPIVVKLKGLTLFNCYLTTFPSSITKLQELEELVLGCNPIGKFDPQITLLPNLKILHLAMTNLEKLDPSITAMKNIKILNLACNTNLGDDALPLLMQLKNLEELHLTGTAMTDRCVAQSFKDWPTPLLLSIPALTEISEDTKQLLTDLIKTTNVHIEDSVYFS